MVQEEVLTYSAVGLIGAATVLAMLIKFPISIEGDNEPPVSVSVNLDSSPQEAIVVSHVVVQQPASGVSGISRRSTWHYIHLPPFRPFVNKLAGLEVPEKVAQTIGASRRELLACGGIEAEIVGSASTSRFEWPNKDANVWGSLRKQYEKSHPNKPGMDHVMNCGLANARAIDAARTLLERSELREHSLDSENSPWMHKRACVDGLRDAVVPGSQVSGKHRERCSLDIPVCLEDAGEDCFARRILAFMKELCKAEQLTLYLDDTTVNIHTHGCEGRVCSSSDTDRSWAHQSVTIEMTAQARGRDCAGNGA